MQAGRKLGEVSYHGFCVWLAIQPGALKYALAVFWPSLATLLDEPQQRQMAVGEVGGFHRPVVHLQVDVAVEVAAPGRGVFLRPDALQIGRQLRVGPRAGDDEVAAELEIERRQGRVGSVLLRFHAVGRGQLGVRPFRQGQPAAFHEAAVVGDRAFPKDVKWFGQGRVEAPPRELRKLPCPSSRCRPTR